VFLEDLEDPIRQACAIAQRILDVLQAPVLLGPREVFVSASIGIALCSGTTDFDELLSQADTAMYAAKRNGKACYSVFEPTLHADAVQRLELETDLRHAIEADQFVLHYQPIVQLTGAQPVGLEALIRWHHPTRGLVAPDQFIPLAEETGLIVPLGRWVLLQACRQVSQLRLNFPNLRELNVSVNVAARQLLEAGFVDDVRSALSDGRLPADALILELTEHALLQRSNATLARLHELRELGVRLALDDFGTGYSSLAYLRDLPFDRVKIDRSFIDGIESKTQQAALVHAIVSLSRALGLETVGEGIELAAQANQLALLGCDLAQGYLFSKPVDAETIARVLGAGVRTQAA
jgi:EAL domain-containing protein (putative c-di-GMP-specific phosphodiesterase class I)